MSTTIAMFGDSYVKRLKEYCSNDLRVPSLVYWFDKCGLPANFKEKRWSTNRHLWSSYLSTHAATPSQSRLHQCGNDVSSQTKPIEIVDRVVSTKEWYQDRFCRRDYDEECFNESRSSIRQSNI